MIKLPKIIRFSPFDCLVFFRITLVLLVWKLLCTDFTGLATVADYAPLWAFRPLWLYLDVFAWQPQIFPSEQAVWYWQFAAVFFLSAAFIKPCRLLLLPGLTLLMTLDLSATIYRGVDWDYGLGIITLLFCLIMPYKFSTFMNKERDITTPATLYGITMAFYFGGMYFLAGMSKVIFPDWLANVTVYNYYFTYNAWFDQILPPIVEFATRHLSLYLIDHETISYIVGLMIMFDQLCWWLAIFFEKIRLKLAFLVWFMHFGIYLSSGIFFLTMPLLALSILVPWRKLHFPVIGFKGMKEQMNEKN